MILSSHILKNGGTINESAGRSDLDFRKEIKRFSKVSL